MYASGKAVFAAAVLLCICTLASGASILFFGTLGSGAASSGGVQIIVQSTRIGVGQPDNITSFTKGNDPLVVYINGISVSSGRGKVEFNINDINPQLTEGVYKINAVDTFTGGNASTAIIVAAQDLNPQVPPIEQQINSTYLTNKTNTTKSDSSLIGIVGSKLDALSLALILLLAYALTLLGYYRYSLNTKR